MIRLTRPRGEEGGRRLTRQDRPSDRPSDRGRRTRSGILDRKRQTAAAGNDNFCAEAADQREREREREESSHLMTGFHADRSVLRWFLLRRRPFSAAVAFFKGFILPRWRWLAGRGSLGGTVVGICPAADRPTTTAAVQLSALNKPAKSSGRRGGGRKGTEGNEETRRGRKPALALRFWFCLFGWSAGQREVKGGNGWHYHFAVSAATDRKCSPAHHSIT